VSPVSVVPGGQTQYAALSVPGGHTQYAATSVPGGQEVVCFLATEAAGAIAATIATAINAASRYFLIVTGLS
jgi:putative intracellular protease/amidase